MSVMRLVILELDKDWVRGMAKITRAFNAQMQNNIHPI